MTSKKIFYSSILIAAFCVVSIASAQEKLSKDEWQQQMTELTQKRDNLKMNLNTINNEIDSLKAYLASLETQIQSAHDERMSLVGPFEESLSNLEGKVDELSRLSNEDLFARKAEVEDAQNQLNELNNSKLAKVPSYAERLQALQTKIDGLKSTLAGTGEGKMYTVGTWAKDRDCLWNIAKKKDIYSNPFMWPKIWQGNRDQIKDPDIIHQGQKLKIPEGSSLTSEEKQAERQYWNNKRK